MKQKRVIASKSTTLAFSRHNFYDTSFVRPIRRMLPFVLGRWLWYVWCIYEYVYVLYQLLIITSDLMWSDWNYVFVNIDIKSFLFGNWMRLLNSKFILKIFMNNITICATIFVILFKIRLYHNLAIYWFEIITEKNWQNHILLPEFAWYKSWKH